MSLTLFQIPENHAEWPKWLEQQIIGLQLSQFVSELRGVNAPNQPPVKLDEVFRDKLASIESHGLIELSSEQLSLFFQHPELLEQLQDHVFLCASDYWDNLSGSDSDDMVIQANASKSRIHLQQELGKTIPAEGLSPDKLNSDKTNPEIIDAARKSRLGRYSAWSAAIAIAASVLFLILQNPIETKPGWGFEKNGLLTAEVSGSQYLNLLSGASADWFNKRPTDTQTLIARLQDYSRGCQQLLEAPNQQLDDSNREWLFEKCKTWKDKIDQLVTDLRSGNKDFQTGLTEADEIAERMKSLLAEKALEIA